MPFSKEVIKTKLEEAVTNKLEAINQRNIYISREEDRIRQLNKDIEEVKEEIQLVKVYKTKRKAVNEVLNIEKTTLDKKLKSLIKTKLSKIETIAKVKREIDEYLYEIKELESEVSELIEKAN